MQCMIALMMDACNNQHDEWHENIQNRALQVAEASYMRLVRHLQLLVVALSSKSESVWSEFEKQFKTFWN